MNLHLFNPTDEVLRGRSGMRIQTLAPNEVTHEAEVVLAGPLNLVIPRGRVVQRGTCTLSSPSTLFSVAPHMHQTGVHAKVVAHSSISGDRLLYDGDYDFNHQLVHAIDPVQLAAGDKVEIECTYLNATDRTLSWGDSSLDEMCFAGLGMYPATGTRSGPCTN
ncbi:MAG TPA: hypothetical protein VJR89_40240 [Polyangiales bacterium]|nr:hypothetical protein [Polyangiales bacterium]